MVMVNTTMGEARSTPPSCPSMAPSPRYGGCVRAFLHLFDWTPARRFAFTKRLSGSKPEKALRRSRSFRGDHGAAGKTRMMCQSGGTAVVDGTRAPGVVARLMGLESLPQQQPPHHGRSQSYSGGDAYPATPILLQDILKRDYKRRTLRDKIPAIFPRRAAAQEEHPKRVRKKSSVSLLTAFRCRPEVSCVSPAYIDIPATSRFLHSVARSPRSPFLSRLPPGSPHEKIPELSLRATSTGTTMLLQGWPLESQRIVPPDIFHEDYSSDPAASTSVASSKPLMAPGRRRGSSWSDGSESTIEQDVHSTRKPTRVKKSAEPVPSPRHRSGNEPAFKTTRRPPSSKAGKRDAENSRASASQESVSASSLGSVTSKPSSRGSKSRDASIAVTKRKEDDDARRVVSSRSRSPSRSKEPPPKVRSHKGAAAQPENSSARRVFPADSPSKGAASPRVAIPKVGDKPHVKKKKGSEAKPGSAALAGGAAGKQATKRVQVHDLGERLKKGDHVNGEGVATQRKGDDMDESTTQRFKRKNRHQNSKHARARSVDDVFPELPFDFENSRVDSKGKLMSTDVGILSLHRPVERVLFGLFSSPDVDCKDGTGDQISSSPLVDFSSGACMLGRLSVDYDELFCSGEYGKEAGMLASGPLMDCDELRSLGDSGPPASSVEDEAIPMEREVDDFADDRPWEDEIVDGGRCCERSCSGPSVSSESLPSDVDGDAWSSCASYHNLGDCQSPRPFEITEIEVNQDHPNSPPTQFVKKSLDPTGLDPLVDEAGQPSPVSILISPFHDEACTTSESSVTDTIHRKLNSELETVDELELNQPTNSDKIRQALLDLSMFRSREESCALEAETMAPGGTGDEQTFIQGVLTAAHFLSTPGSSPNWHDKDAPIDPALFDRLESGDVVEFSCQASGGLWRCDRKLLFDCVNEAFGWHCRRGHQEELTWRGADVARPRGELLVVAVAKQIEEWRKLASYAIDSLIERDMSAHFGNWQRFGPEVAELGLDIETTVWADILEEVIVDMIVSTSKRDLSFS